MNYTHIQSKSQSTLMQLLNLMTRKREYYLITVPNENLPPKLFDRVSCEFCPSSSEPARQTKQRMFLYIGKKIWARENTHFEDYKKYDDLLHFKAYGAEIVFCPIADLYHLAGEKILCFWIQAKTDQEASEQFISKLLRIGTNPGQWYISKSFVQMQVVISDAKTISVPAGSQKESKKHIGNTAEDIRLSDYEVYGEILERLACNDHGYGDDLILEYEISDSSATAYYFLMESYSNHNWAQDPANILTVRMTAKRSDESCDFKEIRFSHPTKFTRNTVTKAPALIRNIQLDCTGAKGLGYIDRINQNQIFENLSDLSAWLFFYHRDIYLA